MGRRLDRRDGGGHRERATVQRFKGPAAPMGQARRQLLSLGQGRTSRHHQAQQNGKPPFHRFPAIRRQPSRLESGESSRHGNTLAGSPPRPRVQDKAAATWNAPAELPGHHRPESPPPPLTPITCLARSRAAVGIAPLVVVPGDQPWSAPRRSACRPSRRRSSCADCP